MARPYLSRQMGEEDLRFFEFAINERRATQSLCLQLFQDGVQTGTFAVVSLRHMNRPHFHPSVTTNVASLYSLIPELKRHKSVASKERVLLSEYPIRWLAQVVALNRALDSSLAVPAKVLTLAHARGLKVNKSSLESVNFKVLYLGIEHEVEAAAKTHGESGWPVFDWHLPTDPCTYSADAKTFSKQLDNPLRMEV